MTTLTECAICSGSHSLMREHCPFCGARRAFIASHSFERYHVAIVARDAENLGREIVRAFSTTICADEQQIMAGDYE